MPRKLQNIVASLQVGTPVLMGIGAKAMCLMVQPSLTAWRIADAEG
jgi:hypothetical protein